VYRAIAATPSPSLDLVLSRLSSAADHSKLWFAVAGALALKPGRPRRAAVLGVASIGLASATANLVGKGLLRRARPDRAGVNVPAGRKVRMPGSTSFPSGHSASAFAFATAVGDELPLAWLPLHAVAAAVTYSRVHTGVHYPGDVLVGSLMGTGAAVAVRYTGRALTRRSAEHKARRRAHGREVGA
jgi:membrane-associated phospholipid phosphatase